MAIPKKRLIEASLQSIMETLERTPPSDKKNTIALELAFSFNDILASVAKEYPELAESLPKPLSTRGPTTQLGRSPASFLDLEIVAEQVLTLLNLVET